MSNALVVLDLSQLPSIHVGTDEQLADLAKSNSFLGRLQLFTKGTAINKGKIRPGHYGIPEQGEDVTDLGDEIDVIALSRRPKALDMSDGEAIIASYDPASDEFKRIAAKSSESESKCMYGTSFLVFERKSARFLEFFCGSKSNRPTAGEIAPFMARSQADIDRLLANNVILGDDIVPRGPKPFTLKVRLAESKKGYSWHVPVVQTCSVPFDNLPALPKILDEITRFTNVVGDGVEKVEETGKKRAR